MAQQWSYWKEDTLLWHIIDTQLCDGVREICDGERCYVHGMGIACARHIMRTRAIVAFAGGR